MLISAKGRAYRLEVIALLANKYKGFHSGERLSVKILLNVPDKRRRDLDNVFKCVLDSMQHAGIYADDSQIDELYIKRGELVKGGKMTIDVESIVNGR
tara:strand:+ start:53 stop:346 length:294 start_codon:yes stop_codon:yes gene_type:complete